MQPCLCGGESLYMRFIDFQCVTLLHERKKSSPYSLSFYHPQQRNKAALLSSQPNYINYITYY